MNASPEPDASRGCVHLYTGDGKGKTTAAVGLALRAAGAGGRVAIVQFDKGFAPDRGEHYHERVMLRLLPRIELYPFGCERMLSDGTFRFGNGEEDFAEAGGAMAKCRELLAAPGYFLLVFDEILTAVETRLVPEVEVLALLARQAETGAAELVLTGRRATPALIEKADLVTEMRPIKHYFEQGRAARRGIEF
jgi:cob(I)alamin adenosyltransferase